MNAYVKGGDLGMLGYRVWALVSESPVSESLFSMLLT